MTDLIADMPTDERPRERLLMHGTRTLSDAELLALVIGTGTRGKSAVQVARELLHDGICQLGRRDVAELARVRGVGTAKATRIAAAFELSRRTATEDDDDRPIYDLEVFAQRLIKTHQYQQEHVGVALLDPHDRIIKQQTIFVGTINHALVSARDIVRFAVVSSATGVVVYHNHPSGNPKPSAFDCNFTTKLSDALSLIDIELVDHLIVGSNKYVSMKGKKR